jgi:pyrrolidone-carboxylate peptidase
MFHSPIIEIRIKDAKGQILKDLDFRFEFEEGQVVPEVHVRHDETHGNNYITLTPFCKGKCTMHVTASHGLTKAFSLEVGAHGIGGELYLLTGKESTLKIGGQEVPIIERKTKMMVQFDDSISEGNRKKVLRLIKPLVDLDDGKLVLLDKGAKNLKALKASKEKVSDIKGLKQQLDKIDGVSLQESVLELPHGSVQSLSTVFSVGLEEGALLTDVIAAFEKLDISVVNHRPNHRNTVTLHYNGRNREQLYSIIKELQEHPLIKVAEPAFEAEIDDTAIYPGDLLFRRQWHSKVLELPDAYDHLNTKHVDLKFGAADVVVAIHDRGLYTTAAGPTFPEHSDYLGNVAGGSLSGFVGNTKKVYFMYKLSKNNSAPPTAADLMAIGNGAVPNTHGTKVTGVATAGSDGINGVAGVAPNARLFSLVRNPSGSQVLMENGFLFISGFNSPWTGDGILYHATQGFPTVFGQAGNPGPGAGVINFSHTFPGAFSVAFKASFEKMTHLGRKRRGVLLFCASANSGADSDGLSKGGSHTNMMKVGASSLDQNGFETTAPYSNYGVDLHKIIDFVAPADAAYNVVNDPPVQYAVLSTDKVGAGNIPGTRDKVAVIQNSPVKGTRDITLTAGDFGDFPATTVVVIRDPVAPDKIETATISSVVAATNTVKIDQDLEFGYGATAEIIKGKMDYTNAFDGTSAACPSATGVGALVLSGNPALSWLEARQIMRETALPIHLDYVGVRSTRKWVEFTGGGPVDLVDAKHLLDLQGPYTESTVAMAKGDDEITVANNTFNERQAVLIGAESTVSVLPVLPTDLLTVARANEFEKGDVIFIGKPIDTYLESNRGAGSAFVTVQNVEYMAIGDELDIGGDQVRITSITYRGGGAAGGNSDSEHRVNFAYLGPNASFPAKARGTAVITHTTQRSGPYTIDSKPGGVLKLLPTLTVAHAADSIVRREGTEVRVVLKKLAANKLKIDPLHFAHPLTNTPNKTHVVGGRKADYSHGSGFGRLDAAKAVKAAIAYDYTERDLMIRNHLTDDGETNLTISSTHSPDLWVANNAPTAVTPPYGDAGPHEHPRSSVSSPIFEGVGLNDLTAAGAYTGVGKAVYTLTISTAAAQDKFKWTKDGGVESVEIDCIVGSQMLDAGFGTQFSAITGHQVGDKWTVEVENIANRFVHLRVKNRGTKAMFVKSTAVGATSVNMYRIYLCLSDGLPVQRFFGAGLNDMTIESEYTGAAASFFTVRIGSTAGAKDKYAWSKGAAALGAMVDIPAGNVLMSDGVNIKFNADTGHTTGDTWMVYSHPVATKWININHYVEENTPAPFSLIPNERGTLLLDEQELPQLAAGSNLQFNVAWPEANRPVTNGPAITQPTKPLRAFILGEALPHDGKLVGDTPETNNNYSYRELLFARFGFKDATGQKNVESFFEVDSFGTVDNKDIKIQVGTSVGTLKTESVKVTVKMEFDNGNVETKIFEYSGGSWQFTGGAPAWISVIKPKIQGGSVDASNEQYSIEFSGTFNVSRNHTRATIKVEVFSTVNILQLLASTEHQIPVYEQAQLPSARFTGASPADLAPRSHFFTVATNLTQVVANSYGPESGSPASLKNKFHCTSLFTAPADQKAFAVVDGIIMVQREAGNNDTVNLIMKPFRQAMLGYTPVKYFVYRGIRLDSYLKGTNATDEKLLRLQAGASTFVDELWNLHIAQNGAATPFETKALGYDPATQNVGDTIDSIFFREDPNLQLPFARRGTHIGEFHANAGGSAFGFEIILEEGTFQPDLAFARKASHIIDVSALPTGSASQLLALKIKREEILNFIDPAAFWGMHQSKDGYVNLSDGVGNTVKLEGAQVFTDVVSKFFTKNTLYLDIRNENGLSLDFHGAYEAGAGNAMEIGDTAGALAPTNYETNDWPILIRSDAGSANPDDFNEVHFKFKLSFNLHPVLYIEHGQPLSAITKGRFIADADLVTGPATETNVIGFRFPNVDLGAGNKAHHAWVLKLHYGVRDGNLNTWPGKVPPTEKYTDNVFGPVDIDILWTGNHKFAWLAAQDKKYIDARANGFEHVVDRGVAINNTAAPGVGRVLFYAAAKDSLFNSNNAFIPYNGMTGGVSKRGSFFEEALLFSGYILQFDVLEEAGTNIQTLTLNQQPGPLGKPVEGMLLLGLSKTEYDNLKALTGFNTSYPRNCHLEALPGNPLTDTNGVSFNKFKVGLRGIKPDGDAFTSFPGTDINVYTVDDLFYFSDDFSADEPLPTTYTRNYEEQIGALKRPPSHYVISSITLPKTVVIAGKDIRYELVKGDKIVIKNSSGSNGTFDVDAVNYVGTDTHVIIVAGALSTAAPLGQLHEIEKPWEDFFIAKDLLAPLGATPAMPVLVNDFIVQITAVANIPAAKASLQSAVDNFAPKILERGRKLCANGSRVYADDRILYWARIKMIVALKSHPYLMQSLGERNKMVKRFESKSRGYETISFTAAGGAKKVLITGYDPFFLNPTNPGHNTYQSNPSGAAALALHGQTLAGVPNAYVQAAVFPVRYRDFDQSGGTGVVEDFFEKYINPAAPGYTSVDLIITLSQGGVFEFWIDRFASRYRGGTIDNENKPSPAGNANFKFPLSVAGDEFYETTLPHTKIVPASNAAKKYPIYYNNSFKYEYDDAGTLKTSEYVKKNSADGTMKIENAAHPDHAALSGLVPTALSGATVPIKGAELARKGSGGAYLSNEIYYRVARIRALHNAALPTGHYHVPLIQYNRTLNAHGGTTTVELHPSNMQDLINDIADAILNGVKP